MMQPSLMRARAAAAGPTPRVADWLDLRLDTGITEGAEFIWEDQSANGNDCRASVRMPTDGGTDGVLFSTDEALTADVDMTFAEDWTLIYEIEQLSGGGTFQNPWAASGERFTYINAGRCSLGYTPQYTICLGPVFATDVIYTLAFTYNVGTDLWELFSVDGGVATLEDSATQTQNGTVSGPTYVGGTRADGTNTFEGYIRQMRVFTDVLTAAEIGLVETTF